MTRRIFAFALLLSVFWLRLGGGVAIGFQDQSEPRSATAALSHLQATQLSGVDVFVPQGELDSLIRAGGGGACARAAGIDIAQTLRVMSGASPIENPHKHALEAFSQQEELLNGRVTNEQFVDLLMFYQQYLNRKLRVEVTSAPASPYNAGGNIWDLENGPEIELGEDELTILSFTVCDDDGALIGRHFVLLKDRSDSIIHVVDPSRPTKDFSYSLRLRPGSLGLGQHVFLDQPPGAPARSRTFELNTIFTVTSEPTASISLKQITNAIDQTAEELKQTEHYLSPVEWRQRTAHAGLPGLDLPASVGGSDWPAEQMIEVFRHAGRKNLNFRDIVGGAHSRPLLQSSHPEVLNIVRQVAAGEGYIAIAITEPTAGSDVPAIQSRCHQVDGGYLLNGAKRFNARLDQASHVIIFTQSATGDKGKLSAFVVPIDAPGLTIERFDAHGLEGNSYGGLTFENLFVPEQYRIGQDGEGLKIFFKHFLYWRLMQTAAAIGTGEQALVQMAERIRKREAFGGPIGRFTHLQQEIGQHTIELRMAHTLAIEAARRLDNDDYGDETRGIICGLKAEGVEIALNASDAAMRAFGGEGYSGRVDLGDRVRDLMGLRIADGTTDVMRMEVVRQLYGEEFWEMAIEQE